MERPDWPVGCRWAEPGFRAEMPRGLSAVGPTYLDNMIPLQLVAQLHDGDLELAVDGGFAARRGRGCGRDFVCDALGDGRAQGGQDSECMILHCIWSLVVVDEGRRVIGSCEAVATVAHERYRTKGIPLCVRERGSVGVKRWPARRSGTTQVWRGRGGGREEKMPGRHIYTLQIPAIPSLPILLRALVMFPPWIRRTLSTRFARMRDVDFRVRQSGPAPSPVRRYVPCICNMRCVPSDDPYPSRFGRLYWSTSDCRWIKRRRWQLKDVGCGTCACSGCLGLGSSDVSATLRDSASGPQQPALCRLLAGDRGLGRHSVLDYLP